MVGRTPPGRIRGRRTPRRSQPRAGRSQDGLPQWTEGVRRPASVRLPTCSPTERGTWSAHRDGLSGSIPAQRRPPPRAEVGLAAERVHPGHLPTLARRASRRRLGRCGRSLAVRRHRQGGAHRRLTQPAPPPALRLADPVRAPPITAETLAAGGEERAQAPPEQCDGIARPQPVTGARGRVFPPHGPPPVLARQQATRRARDARGRARETAAPAQGHRQAAAPTPPRLWPGGGAGTAAPVLAQCGGGRAPPPAGRLPCLSASAGAGTDDGPPPQDTDREEAGRSTGSPRGPLGCEPPPGTTPWRGGGLSGVGF
jgi:hypothetical protein